MTEFEVKLPLPEPRTSAFRALTKPERAVISLRFGIITGHDEDIARTARWLSTSKINVESVYDSAMEKLHRPLSELRQDSR